MVNNNFINILKRMFLVLSITFLILGSIFFILEITMFDYLSIIKSPIKLETVEQAKNLK